MQTTFSNGLGVSFFGKGVTPGMPAHVANGGTRTIGGTIDKSNTNIAKFGCALFVDPAKPSNFIVGPTVSATLFRGILMRSPSARRTEYALHARKLPLFWALTRAFSRKKYPPRAFSEYPTAKAL